MLAVRTRYSSKYTRALYCARTSQRATFKAVPSVQNNLHTETMKQTGTKLFETNAVLPVLEDSLWEPSM